MPFQIVRQDITKMKVDAIVNSAHPEPLVGGGVDLAIHDAGGQKLVEARKALGYIHTSQVKHTKGYNLYARYVLHTVGPIWGDSDENQEKELSKCYNNSLKLAKELKCKSIAFPLISAGVFGCPRSIALSVATSSIKEFLAKHEMMVYLVIFDKISYLISRTKYNDIQSYIDDQIVYEQKIKELKYLSKIDSSRIDLHREVSDDFDYMDDTWQEALMKLIIASGKTNAQVYKKANISKQHFSKILKNVDYHPSKPTVIAFCLALKLNLDETIDLLEKAGYQLSLSIKFDIIIRYYLEREIYDIFEINETLFDFDQELLGSYSL